MQPFDLEQLRSLVIAVEEGSLSAAAPKLYRSQSAVSEQIRKLENFAGVVLLHRGKAGVRPTPAGERLLVHAREMLAASDRALEDMRGMGLAGELRLAITDYFQPGTIAQILRHRPDSGSGWTAERPVSPSKLSKADDREPCRRGLQPCCE